MHLQTKPGNRPAAASRFIGLLAALVCAFVAPAVHAQNPPAQLVSSNRFLCVFDTSAASARHGSAIMKSVHEILASRASGQLHYGDTLGVWTFDTQLHVGGFPLQVWTPADEPAIPSRITDFLTHQAVADTSRLPTVMAGLAQLIKDPGILTVLIYSTGESPITGTPFDQDINAAYQRALKDMGKNRMPVVTVLQAKGDKFLTYTVSALPWPVAIPELPIPIKLAKNPAPAAPTTASTPQISAPAVANAPAPAAPAVSPPPIPAPAANPPASAPVAASSPPPTLSPASPVPVDRPAVAAVVPPVEAAPPAPVPAVASSPLPMPVPAAAPANPPNAFPSPRQMGVATSGMQPALHPPRGALPPPSMPAPPFATAEPRLREVPAPGPVARSVPAPLPMPTKPAVVAAPVPPSPGAESSSNRPAVVSDVAIPPATSYRSKTLLVAGITLLLLAVCLGVLAFRRSRSASGPSLISRSLNNRR